MSASDPAYTAESVYEFNVPCRITPGALAVHMTTLSNMFPAQFINAFSLRYDEESNRTFITVITNGERYAGQFDFSNLK